MPAVRTFAVCFPLALIVALGAPHQDVVLHTSDAPSQQPDNTGSWSSLNDVGLPSTNTQLTGAGSDEVAALHEAMTGSLHEAVERSAGLAAADLKAEKKSGLRVHGRTGQPCPVCGDTVHEVSFADSSLQYCPTCQTGGKPLADRRMSRLLK